MITSITTKFNAFWKWLKGIGSKLISNIMSLFGSIGTTLTTIGKYLGIALKGTGKFLLSIAKLIPMIIEIVGVAYIALEALIIAFKAVWTGIAKLINLIFKTDIPTPESILKLEISNWIAEWIEDIKDIEEASAALDDALKNFSIFKQADKEVRRLAQEVLNYTVDFSIVDLPAANKLIVNARTSNKKITDAKASISALMKQEDDLLKETNELRAKLAGSEADDVDLRKEISEKIKANIEAINETKRQIKETSKSIIDAGDEILSTYREIFNARKSIMDELDKLKLDRLNDEDKLAELNKKIKEGYAKLGDLIFNPEAIASLRIDIDNLTRGSEALKAKFKKQASDYENISNILKFAAATETADTSISQLMAKAKEAGGFGKILGLDGNQVKEAFNFFETTSKRLQSELGVTIDTMSDMNQAFDRYFLNMRSRVADYTRKIQEINNKLAALSSDKTEANLAEMERLLEQRLATENSLNDTIRTGNNAIMDFIKHIAELASEESKLSQNWIDNMERSAMETWKMQHMAADQTINPANYSDELKKLKSEIDTKATLDELIKIKEAQGTYQANMLTEVKLINKKMDKPTNIALETVNATP